MDSSTTGGYLQSQVIKHCAWNDVTPARSIKELVAEKKKFRIVFYKPTDFNNFNVMESEVKIEDYFHLREEIAEVAEMPDLKLDGEPYTGEVVLAQHPNYNNEYHRAIIEKIHFAAVDSWAIKPNPDDSYADVYFFDVGGYFRVNLKDMKPVTKPIMTFPVLSYKVTLYTEERYNGKGDHIPFTGEGLILNKHFETLMETVKKFEVILNVDIVESTLPMFHVTDLFNITPVSIRYISTTNFKQSSPRLQPSLLTEKLDNLKVWEWEKVVKNSGKEEKVNDDYIFKHGLFGKVGDSISTFMLEPGAHVTAQVTRVIPSTIEPSRNAEIRVILLDEPQHVNYRMVIHNQMERYAKTVSKSPFNPAIKDVFMFKLDKKKEYSKKGTKGLGEWCRAIKMDSDWVYLLDWDENIPLAGVDTDDYDMRPLYREFLKVPSLVLHFCPLDDDIPVLYKKALDLIKPGTRYSFRVDYAHPDHDFHEVSCLGPAETKEGREDELVQEIKNMNVDYESDTTSTSSSDSD